MFENAQIDTEGLPRVETVAWQELDPKYVRKKLTESALGFVFTIGGVAALYGIFSVAFVDEDIGFGWLWLVPLVVGLPLFTWPLVSVPRKAYALRQRDIVYKSGVFWRTVTALPFNRIQHVERSSTPLDRRFRIANLQLYTAGGSGGDLRIQGLPERTAEKLRAFILEKIGSGVEQR